MTNNFDLKKFLTENKLTNNSKLISEAYTPHDALMRMVDSMWGDSSKRLEVETAIDNAYEQGEFDTEDLENLSKDQLLRWAESTIHNFGEKEGWYEEPNRDMGWDERDDRMEEEVDPAYESNERNDSDLVSEIRYFLKQYINLEYDKDTLLDNITYSINNESKITK